MMMKYRHLTVRETAEQVEISTGSLQSILCNHRKICFQAFVGGTEKLKLAIGQDQLDINGEPDNFLLFQKMKMPLKESRFQGRDEIRQKVTAVLNIISREMSWNEGARGLFD
ncbi:hypothetical protein TNCV_4184711 [Trichonephila clavipes]|nr:hypothetical protein TNCV_4184711 [Trichonephila clavipes]